MASSLHDETLVEERSEEMTSPFNGKPSWRFAYFLKPSNPSSKNTQNPKNFNKPITKKIQSLHSNVKFHGWNNQMQQWSCWVEKMRPLYETIWKKTSIYESILSSTLEIPRCYDLIFALAERFCTKTNTFVLPWGEVTMTLEDVMVLGGYSVTGNSVLSRYDSMGLWEIEDQLQNARMEISRSKAKKASQHQWRDKWMGKGSEVEHEAFLCLWLSRFVFAADSFAIMNKIVFPIAVLLARGTKIALAPAVLASIYRDLRLLKEKIESLGDGQVEENVAKLCVFAPFQLLQLWVWERFPTLSPNPNPIITNGLPRSSRWQKVNVLKEDHVGLLIDSAEESFRWRPYSTPLNNWSFGVKIYPEIAEWVPVGSVIDIGLDSYVRCIRVSELAGVEEGCVEQYLPHRVSMQFGLDQDVPVDIPRLNDNREVAWSNYNRPITELKVYVPSKLMESDVTTQYLDWCKKLKFVKGKTSGMAERLKIKLENNEAEIPPGFTSRGKRNVGNVSFDQPSSKRSKASLDYHGDRMENNKAEVTPGSSPQRDGKGSEDDSDSDCDYLTLSQLLGIKGTKKAQGDDIPSVCRSNSPLSSGGDNVSARERESSTNHEKCLGRSEGRRRKSNDVIESKVESPMRRPMSTNKNEFGTSCSESSEHPSVDLAHRIARLQRIVNMVKAAKLGFS